MNETASLIHDAAHRLFAQHVTPELLLRAEQGEWSEALWDAIEEAGLDSADALRMLADRVVERSH